MLPPVKPDKPSEPRPVKAPVATEQTRARIAAAISRAGSFRGQGNYAAALAELEKAKTIDNSNEEIRKEIEQTRRACKAEVVLGNKINC
jgi:Tfp pilus assembly protein PilF